MNPFFRTLPFLLMLTLSLTIPTLPADSPAAQPTTTRVGVAQLDITPDYAVRLSGFGFRREQSEGITQHIFAKALAFADDQQGPAILITVDNLCVPDEITAEI